MLWRGPACCSQVSAPGLRYRASPHVFPPEGMPLWSGHRCGLSVGLSHICRDPLPNERTLVGSGRRVFGGPPFVRPGGQLAELAGVPAMLQKQEGAGWGCPGPARARLIVLQNVRIDPNSLSYNMWKEIPVPFYLSVYFFNVLNPSDVLEGGKPQVQERGPYVYREFRHKINITFNDNDTVSYREVRRFQFEPEKSCGTESDRLMLPNIMVMGAAALMENKPVTVKVMMALMLSSFGEQAFMNISVGEIMWGYESKLLNFLNQFFPNTLPFKGKFGLFAEVSVVREALTICASSTDTAGNQPRAPFVPWGLQGPVGRLEGGGAARCSRGPLPWPQLNNSDSGLFTVFTGVQDFSRIHQVDKWNGLSKVNYWRSDQCNMINGTAGQMWAPFMTPDSSLEFYSPEACRSMKLIFKESGAFKGIPTYRFVAPRTLFANGSVYPPNEGFCPCLQSGIQNVSTCRFNAPLFLSHPHFYNADPELAEAVSGLHPNEEEHSLFLDIHPVTGIPMNCSVKLQLNLYMKAVKGIGQTGKIRPVVLPLLWFGESGAMEGSTLRTFYNQLVLLPKSLFYVQYLLVALGCVLVLISSVYVLMTQGPDDATGQPPLTAQPDWPPSPSTPLLQDAPGGQPAGLTV
ncbi:Scavenger receptor class B member 1 [Galemys pyrenaicus]|uniref:Scavenger receptor class B member 1 n=1 Tax=Galemys pyrenaicus TaxID=202257 RepID=A0A8J6DP89_GALPY|nr:Scavenger receptor class B member 1 [Galemys pyrenaicus]